MTGVFKFQDRLMRSLVTSIFPYACESWTPTAELQRRIQATEMRRFRKIPGISYKDRVTNVEVRAKIQQAIGPHKDLLTIVKKCKLQWYGHVSRSSGQAKTILQGTVKRGKETRQTEKEVGRQHQGMDRPGVLHSERGKKTRQTEKEVGRQHQGMDRLGVRQVPEGSGEFS